MLSVFPLTNETWLDKNEDFRLSHSTADTVKRMFYIK